MQQQMFGDTFSKLSIKNSQRDPMSISTGSPMFQTKKMSDASSPDSTLVIDSSVNKMATLKPTQHKFP